MTGHQEGCLCRHLHEWMYFRRQFPNESIRVCRQCDKRESFPLKNSGIKQAEKEEYNLLNPNGSGFYEWLSEMNVH